MDPNKGGQGADKVMGAGGGWPERLSNILGADTCRHLPDLCVCVCVCVCVFLCASTKVPDTCRYLPNFCDTCQHLPWQVLAPSMVSKRVG